MSQEPGDLTVCNTPVLAQQHSDWETLLSPSKGSFSKHIKYDNLLVNFSTAIAATTSNHAAEKLRQVET